VIGGRSEGSKVSSKQRAEEDRSRKSEVGGRKSEVGGKRDERPTSNEKQRKQKVEGSEQRRRDGFSAGMEEV